MKDSNRKVDVSRRGFLRGAGLLGLGGAVAALAGRAPGAVAPKKPAAPAEAKSGYDIEKFRKTDPALMGYELADRLSSPLPAPRRITFGPDGALWLTAGKNVAVLSKEGAWTGGFALPEEIQCLAVSLEGLVYAGFKDHVEVFDSRGKPHAKWAAPAPKAWLASIAVGERDVFVSDSTGKVVHHYDRSGRLRGRIGEKNKAKDIPAFLVPSPYFDMELGADDYLWVVNPGLHQFQAFTFDGELEKKWGEASFAISGFCGCCNPSYFCRLADGRFVTSEKGLARVKVYSPEGKFDCVVAGAEEFPKYFENLNATPTPMDVAADASGRVFVADTLGNQIRIYRKKAAPA